MLITPFYAAVLGIIFVTLSVRTLRLRRTLSIAIGDAGNQQLLRAIRVHANFAEYVPLALLLIYLLEAQGPPKAVVHILCIALLLGRLSHAFGVSKSAEDYRFRVFGMALTLTTLIVSSIYLLFFYAGQFVV